MKQSKKTYIRIAICDDEVKVCSMIEQILMHILDAYGISYRIEIFYSGEALCEQLKTEKYNLVFLDIELQNMNGVAVGHFIREQLGNEELQIAYISAKKEYAMELFEYRPINFLTKPIDETKVRKVIDKYRIINGHNEDIFTYKKQGEICQVKLSEIRYFMSKGRKITLVTESGEDEFYSTMDHIQEQVEGKRFLYVHQSYMVNCSYISRMAYEQLELSDGTVIPISRSKRPEVRKQFLELKRGES